MYKRAEWEIFDLCIRWVRSICRSIELFPMKIQPIYFEGKLREIRLENPVDNETLTAEKLSSILLEDGNLCNITQELNCSIESIDKAIKLLDDMMQNGV